MDDQSGYCGLGFINFLPSKDTHNLDYYKSKFFNLPPSEGIPDFRGGMLGSRKDYDLRTKIPLERQCDFYELLMAIGKANGRSIPEEDAATHIRRNMIDYCKTYQERLDRLL